MAGSEGLWIYGQHRGQRLDSLRQRETVREPRGNKGEKGLGGRGEVGGKRREWGGEESIRVEKGSAGKESGGKKKWILSCIKDTTFIKKITSDTSL